MLQLKNIVKNYISGDTTVEALKGVDLEFRKNEFVSILGPSGCGKTTLLNIIGGLDKYTSGDLIINGKSTKDFKDRDWDTYRNNSIGFVFQSYNLIPHQTVLSNVELALTLSGVSREERRERAKKALEEVGLGNQLHKKPNQMSGGQMQRVAIARAIVNNPDILLADEPTGALDSETSVQIMELLKKIAQKRLIIMVTHNPELAEKYSTRIIKILDGKIVDDSNPYRVESEAGDSKTDEKSHVEKISETEENTGNSQKKKRKKTSMSFLTALSLSLNNLLTKKGRTFLTAFAGSIGIIGIALILSLSSGMQNYIDKVQEDTLTSYPITIEEQAVDMTTMMTSMMSAVKDDGQKHDDGKIYSRNIMNKFLSSMTSQIKTNNLGAFKEYIESQKGKENDISAYASNIQYSYNIDLNIYDKNTADGIKKINPTTFFDDIGLGTLGQLGTSGPMSSMSGAKVWKELIDSKSMRDSQYELVYGKWPEKYNEVVLIVDKNNEISDYTLYTLGLLDEEEMVDDVDAILSGRTDDIEENEQVAFTYEDICNVSYKMVPNCELYKKTDNLWVNMSTNEEFMKNVIENAEDINVVGIIKSNNENSMNDEYGSIGYTTELTKYIIEKSNGSEIAKEQLANPDTDIFTGKKFEEEETPGQPVDTSNISPEQMEYYASLSDEERQAIIEAMTATTKNTYDSNVKAIGIFDLEKPSTINIYPKDFDSKEKICDIIEKYNKMHSDAGEDEYNIKYSDVVGAMMSSVSNIINIISTALMAFVSISLVVSSIMIAIITYISVLERTKEIGILRSIGASKKDVSRVFNAETLIIGFVSGTLGIVITLLLCIPVNMIIENISGVSGIAALPVDGAVILIIISIVLTIVSGFIPAKMAAKKDPVVALRTE